MNEKDFSDLLKKHKARYECLKNGDGKRLTRLVSYTGKYDDGDGKMLHYVGEEYINMAMIEENPAVLYQIAEELCSDITGDPYIPFLNVDSFCGAPEGGKALALLLALICRGRYVYPDKTTGRNVMTGQEWKEFSLGRHSIKKGERVAIVEDVLNNFSTTDSLIELIENLGGSIPAIVAIVNRSNKAQHSYTPDKQPSHKSIPIICLVRKAIPQYKQHDPYVADDVKNGNVERNPKENWVQLIEQMEQANV